MVHPQVELYTGKVDAFMQKYPSVTQYGTWIVIIVYIQRGPYEML